MINYGDFIAFAAVETERRVLLSPDSLTLLSFTAQWLRNPLQWEHNGEPLNPLEEDVRDAAVAQAFYELGVQNVDTGTIVIFATTAVPSDMLECDGTGYLRVDYPELYAVLDSAFIVDADNFIVPTITPPGAGLRYGLWAK